MSSVWQVGSRSEIWQILHTDGPLSALPRTVPRGNEGAAVVSNDSTFSDSSFSLRMCLRWRATVVCWGRQEVTYLRKLTGNMQPRDTVNLWIQIRGRMCCNSVE